ncbi:Na+/H+ antiporter subunit D [Staphylococcus pseudintermedius]|uniref:Na+/H+ antiporter subunit D n=1 Tax=Staphylococcus pseudintermedius TaxID=283734 RepID=UPI0019FDF2DF|nr:Na+/H+ antiporter subunit D [Staphylococcus pseudintermedius]EGQ0306878.1 Na+/H+ antiporter subunit D [Staphylococcus pseudintermedius]EGQ0358993.1 Na+/H+ antiporter subunit D [Staphylococcus pseudintermedius]EGQ1769249.1 Na+/H+ antiporter subunit D [Staphylococcus pseudintermedius]EGQ2782387.1 Na+/H+ antiporter subunit D [Staphylococcus pseudintermedius]EGQ2815094.1 Na+/H+ antiporter subunit D [Staphylococcus pseudintermedius]
MNDNLLAVPILVPLICALFLVILHRQVRLSRRIALGALLISFIVSLIMLIEVMKNGPMTLDFGDWPAPFGIQYVGDPLSLILVTTTFLVVFMIVAFGFGRGEKRASRYYLLSFILFLTTGVVGSFLTADLFNLYVMFEIMLLASFVLVTLGQSVEQLRASIIYVVLNVIGSWFFLVGIGLLYRQIGTLNFTHIAIRIQELHDPTAIHLVAMSFIVAFGSKAALVLFMWLPKAYAVLNTELAALFASLMTKVGAYALIRFFTLIFNQSGDIVEPLLIVMSCLTMLIGAIGTVAYKDIKKIAAYQVVLSIGFVIFGLGTHTFYGVNGAIFYLVSDMIVKALLFFIIGIIVYTTGYRQYRHLKGLAKKEPWLGVALIIVTLAIGGVPPLSGFPGKLLIFMGAIQHQHYIGLTLMILTSLIGMYSLFRVFFYMYAGNDVKGAEMDYKPIRVNRKTIVMFMTGVTLAMGLFAPIIYKVTEQATNLSMDPHQYEKMVNPELRGGS